jgi:hypothetical protein
MQADVEDADADAGDFSHPRCWKNAHINFQFLDFCSLDRPVYKVLSWKAFG